VCTGFSLLPCESLWLAATISVVQKAISVVQKHISVSCLHISVSGLHISVSCLHISVSCLHIPVSCLPISVSCLPISFPVVGLVLPAAGVRLVVSSCCAWSYFVKVLLLLFTFGLGTQFVCPRSAKPVLLFVLSVSCHFKVSSFDPSDQWKFLQVKAGWILEPPD
jgi:hypothetical protein